MWVEITKKEYSNNFKIVGIRPIRGTRDPSAKTITTIWGIQSPLIKEVRLKNIKSNEDFCKYYKHA